MNLLRELIKLLRRVLRMNKQQFINKLTESLQRLPANDRTDIVHDFEEHFEFGLQEGKSEEEIAASLGSPAQISKELLASYHLDQVDEKTSAGNMFRAVWAVLGLGFFNLVIVLGPFIALVGVLVGGWVSGLAFIVSPLLLALDTLLHPQSFNWFNLFVAIGLTGLGLLVVIAMMYVTQFFMKGFVRYLHFNVRFVKGGLKDA